MTLHINYSLAGAEYQLKYGNVSVAVTLITDENGNTIVSCVNVGNYTLVEAKALSGFELNSQHTSVTITVTSSSASTK